MEAETRRLDYSSIVSGSPKKDSGRFLKEGILGFLGNPVKHFSQAPKGKPRRSLQAPKARSFAKKIV